MESGSTSSNGAVGLELIDTNILIYAYDVDEPAKHAVAHGLIRRLSDERRLVMSTQVLNEFCNVMMRRGRMNRLSPEGATEAVARLLTIGVVFPMTPALTLRAVAAVRRHGLSFWDALIWAAAAENGVGVVYTEDFQHGREVEGVRFINPFLEAGDP